MKKKKMFIDEKCKDCPYYYGEIVGALVRYIGIHELEYIVCDINEFNKAFAPVKEMTIAEIEKELGYKIKIVGKDKGEK